ncbi:MAG: hypothetical protein KGI92_03160, partial [Alphaproteobacteria bacterium]|nr:hypothetical protein [Alphaproteobacteria bacterium]
SAAALFQRVGVREDQVSGGVRFRPHDDVVFRIFELAEIVARQMLPLAEDVARLRRPWQPAPFLTRACPPSQTRPNRAAFRPRPKIALKRVHGSVMLASFSMCCRGP